jgi:acetate kinase
LCNAWRASIDTSMSFTSLDGLVMGTRCGSIDPGVLLYLLEERGMAAPQIAHMLYSESGLLAVSGVSSDMRVLLETDPRVAEAIDLFVYRIVREAGGLAASLGGLDGLIFSAGIGENAPEIRARVCQGLGCLGMRLDPEANRRGDARISAPDSAVIVRVIPTDEERMIALHTVETLGLAGAIRQATDHAHQPAGQT